MRWENIQSFLHFFDYFFLFFLIQSRPFTNLFQRATTTRAQIPFVVIVTDTLTGINCAFRLTHDKISRRNRFARLVPPRRRDDPERAGMVPVPLTVHKHDNIIRKRVEPQDYTNAVGRCPGSEIPLKSPQAYNVTDFHDTFSTNSRLVHRETGELLYLI